MPREVARGAFLFGQTFERNETLPDMGTLEGFCVPHVAQMIQADCVPKSSFTWDISALPFAIRYASVFPICSR